MENEGIHGSLKLESTCSYITLIIAHVKEYYNDKVLLTPSYDYAA
jgi:hypothetical protein